MEKSLVWNEHVRVLVPSDYATLTDEEWTAIADRTIVLLDQKEEDVR
ncbi:MAG: hypothetical protein M1608_08695 [Candidatus Omnitrophica bacterium]|nr:hypothetical protein [Candidatus Omnitrophota bacterium]